MTNPSDIDAAHQLGFTLFSLYTKEQEIEALQKRIGVLQQECCWLKTGALRTMPADTPVQFHSERVAVLHTEMEGNPIHFYDIDSFPNKKAIAPQ